MELMTDETYRGRCREAATAQGLDPVLAYLDGAGLEPTIEHRGGWEMAVVVRSPTTGEWISVTNEDGVLVACRYALTDEQDTWLERDPDTLRRIGEYASEFVRLRSVPSHPPVVVGRPA